MSLMWLPLAVLALLCQNIRSTAARKVHFVVVLTSSRLDPIGYGSREGITINGTSPGPELRLLKGDDVEFLVTNHLHYETAVHFHGIDQRDSPWSDGTPGVSQYAIMPGASYLYRWHAHEAGVYFYHGHSRGQIMDGLYGAIVVLPSSLSDRPFHLITQDDAEQQAMQDAEAEIEAILFGDYTQLPFSSFAQVQDDSNVEILCMDAIIVNGAGSAYCLGREAIDSLTDSSVWALLDLVGVSGGLTDKGCLPPLGVVQGDFDMNLTALPESVFYKCTESDGRGVNYTVNVDSGLGWAAVSFVNVGAQHPLMVAIDNHRMYVFAVDGQYVYPSLVDQVVVGNGNRVSVLVRLDQVPGRYKIRIAHQLATQVLGGYADLVYNNIYERAPSEPKVDFAGRPLSGLPEFVRFDETLSIPYPTLRPSTSVQRTFKLLLKKLGRPYSTWEWTLSGTSKYGTPELGGSPLLLQLPLQPSELILQTRMGEWVDIIVETEGPIARYHPMHKHGNKFFLTGSGTGRFPWDTVTEGAHALPEGSFNFDNPPYLDTVQTQRSMTGAWLALRYKVEQSGAWLFHCHIQPHLSGGMGVVILDGVDQYPEVPEAYREWNGFDKPTVQEVKSELRR